MSKVTKSDISKAAAERGALNRQLYQVTSQLESQKVLGRRSKLTLTDLQTMPEDIVTYRTVGRMFMKEDVSALKTEIGKIISTADSEVERLEKARTVVENQLQAATKNLNELLEQAKE